MVGGGTQCMNLGQFCKSETRVLNNKVFLFRTNMFSKNQQEKYKEKNDNNQLESI